MFQYLRLVRLCGPDAPRADYGHALRPAPLNFASLLTLCLAAAAVLLQSSLPVRAEGEVVDGMSAPLDLDTQGDMPANNPRIAGILAAHPNKFVVICVAGCDGKPKAVQVLPKPVTTRSGTVVPSSADMSKSAYGPPAPGSVTAKERNDVVCLAGCKGRTGQVLQSFADLPPMKRPVPKKTDDDTAFKPQPKKKSDSSLWDELIP